VGQITNPITLGITVNPIDRESGPTAAGGATGNNSIFLGLNAGRNSSVSQLIVIGSQSGSGGITDTANLTGTTIVGAFSAGALTGAAATLGPLTVIGSNNMNAVTNADTSVIIGSGILAGTTDATDHITQDVLIGNQIQVDATSTGMGKCVVIGYQAQNSTGNSTSTNNVVIGCQAFQTSIGSCVDNVFIGFQVMGTASVAGPSQNVVIGSGANLGTLSQSDSVVIGFNATTAGASAVGNHVCIGQGAVGNTATDAVGGNVVIGQNARVTPGETLGQNVIIGSNAGRSLAGITGNVLVLETNNSSGTAQKCLVFGQFASGNIVLGNSISGTSQDTGGAGATNIVKLINGTIGAAAPVGGGYFYVTAGNLHWVSSAGVDSQLSETAAGQLASNAIAAYTNNAAAAAGTLTNAPVAGNPTKWIPINDNGTIRNIPAW